MLPVRYAARTPLLYPILLTAAFVLSRAAALAVGLHYSAVETVWFWQLLDLDVLQHHLGRGLMNLHGQPPLYNAMVGVALKLAGASYGSLILGLQLLLGLAASLAVYFTLLRLRIAPLASFVIALAMLLSPTAILYEFDALYTQLVYAGLCLLGLALAAYIETLAAGWLMAALAVGVMLTLTRATYQWVWLVPLCVLLWWLLPTARSQTLRISVVFVVLSVLWPLKNLVRFHHFSSSTWLPYSVAKHWSPGGGSYDANVRAAVARGELPTFTYSEAEGAERESAWLRERFPAPVTGAPELDRSTKSVGGSANWNSLSLLRMHDAQAKDIRYLLRHDPAPLVTETFKSLRLYFEPTSRYFLISQNEAAEEYHRLAPMTHAVDRVCCNLFGLPPDFRNDYRPATQADAKDHATGLEKLQRLCLSAMVGALLFLGALVSTAKTDLWLGAPDRRAAVLVLGWTVAWVFLVTSLAETGENMRFRFETQALAVVVIAAFLQQLWEWRMTERTK